MGSPQTYSKANLAVPWVERNRRPAKQTPPKSVVPKQQLNLSYPKRLNAILSTGSPFHCLRHKYEPFSPNKITSIDDETPPWAALTVMGQLSLWRPEIKWAEIRVLFFCFFLQKQPFPSFFFFFHWIKAFPLTSIHYLNWPAPSPCKTCQLCWLHPAVWAQWSRPVATAQPMQVTMRSQIVYYYMSR